MEAKEKRPGISGLFSFWLGSIPRFELCSIPPVCAVLNTLVRAVLDTAAFSGGSLEHGAAAC
ncbi:MAG: hypothetical protein E5W26_20280 [Mesorhizobium sp.]|uniref:hypothetical protein n=1 Tax=Mesorhizobium sp. TaxID=1871066 RepID=UPI00120ACDD6|nr:hypothetical protein [Mesorhizobium sp.]TIU37711.1 MAG: hypothetical protein E5W26_20280 [Mesorhizobium sp.]